MPPGGSPLLHTGGGEIHKRPISGQGRYINPCRLGGSPPLKSGGQNERWPTSGQGGYLTHASWGVATASQRGGGDSEVARKWARLLHKPCRLGGSPLPNSGGQIRSGPEVGKVAT